MAMPRQALCRWLVVLPLAAAALPAAAQPAAALPQRLSATGLYLPGGGQRLRPDVLAFAPQYPLWSDGAAKRRWLWLPPGSSIDASQPDAWNFPTGTRLCKQFSHAGRAVETRYIERLGDGTWRFATYVWDADGRDATLAPARGIATLPVAGAPAGRYAVPSRGDGLACHADAPVPVLGVSAVQLSPDRDPLAPNAEPLQPGDADLRRLVARGWLRGLPPALLAQPPRIAASSATERAALGYLHGNCGHCHHRAGHQVPLALTLAQTAAAAQASAGAMLASTLAAPSRYTPPGKPDAAQIVAPGDAGASELLQRMRSRQPQQQMPPLGTQRPDPQGLALVQRWIEDQQLNTNREEHRP